MRMKTSRSGLPRSQETIDADSGFAQYCPQRSFGHVPGVVRDRDLCARIQLAPHFMASGRRAVETKSKRAEALRNFAIAESRQTAHQGIGTGTRNSRVFWRDFENTDGRGSPCSRQDSTILRATL